MRRVVLAAAVLAATFTGPAAGAPRDGKIHQTITNTLGANLQRRGYELSGPVAQNTWEAFNNAVIAAEAAGDPNNVANPPTWQNVLMGLGALLPWPLDVGRNDQVEPGGGGFGGGGATGSWDEELAEADCAKVDINFDAQGFLIIPSYGMDFGAPIRFGQPFYGQSAGSVITHASSPQAWVRRVLHNHNMGRPKHRWYGAIGVHEGNTYCIAVAAPATRTAAGVVEGREFGVWCSGGPYVNENEGGFGGPHAECPPQGAGAGNFHPYAEPGWGNGHVRQGECLLYYPNQALSPDGYAHNPYTSVPWDQYQSWPRALDDPYKKCLLDPEFVKRLTDALYKKASDTPDYDGAPYSPIQDEDVRVGDATVDDLMDDPSTGSNNPPPNDGVNDPPTPPSVEQPGGGMTDTCDFGPTGCTDPGTQSPTLAEPPTGIMDPIFNWLPDLPSITFPDLGEASCPVWNVDLRDYGGPSWQWLMDSHCQIAEQNRAAIGALMVAIWGIAAALVILRA